jgi:DNA-directed RNA polymerase II subunit RPB2
LKIPEIGDKFASMAAQKGTCGIIYNQEDMPFTEDGISPDIILNPHAIPSRMTISMLLEMQRGKSALLKGILPDATTYSKNSVEIVDFLCDELLSVGYDPYGMEIMTSGMTGKPFHGKTFIGPSYYQKLKHMASDKMHARAFGNVTSLTRQPLAGRSKDGGLRAGEMEKDCLLSHGSSQFLKERLFDMSDPFQVMVCQHCKIIPDSKYSCQACGKDNIILVDLPYASKLFVHLLKACLIKVKIHTKI